MAERSIGLTLLDYQGRRIVAVCDTDYDLESLHRNNPGLTTVNNALLYIKRSKAGTLFFSGYYPTRLQPSLLTHQRDIAQISRTKWYPKRPGRGIEFYCDGKPYQGLKV